MNPAVTETNLITYKFDITGFVASPLTTVTTVVTSNKLTALGLKVAVQSDILATPALTATYSNIAFPTPGTGNITVVSWNNIATKLTKDSEPVAISDGTFTGTGKLTVTVPASNPSGAVDVVGNTYPCTLSITTVQNVLNSN